MPEYLLKNLEKILMKRLKDSVKSTTIRGEEQ